MRVVIDSNVLISTIGQRSKLRPIWDSFIDGNFTLVVSEDILKEYEEIMQEHSAPGASEIIMEIFVESPDVLLQQVYYNWNLIDKDPDDNKFFDIAVASNADYLVTNDRHFDIVKNLPFPNVNIINSEQFLEIILKSPN